jgi:hypothetical protein
VSSRTCYGVCVASRRHIRISFLNRNTGRTPAATLVMSVDRQSALPVVMLTEELPFKQPRCWLCSRGSSIPQDEILPHMSSILRHAHPRSRNPIMMVLLVSSRHHPNLSASGDIHPGFPSATPHHNAFQRTTLGGRLCSRGTSQSSVPTTRISNSEQPTETKPQDLCILRIVCNKLPTTPRKKLTIYNLNIFVSESREPQTFGPRPTKAPRHGVVIHIKSVPHELDVVSNQRPPRNPQSCNHGYQR